MFCWLLYLSKASIFQTLLYCLSHFSSAAWRLSVSVPPPEGVSPFCPTHSLLPPLSELATHFQPNPLNRQWHFPHCGCIFLFQELPVSPLHSRCHLHRLYLPCSLLFSLYIPDCPTSASSAPGVAAAKPSSLPISLAGSSISPFYLYHQI